MAKGIYFRTHNYIIKEIPTQKLPCLLRFLTAHTLRNQKKDILIQILCLPLKCQLHLLSGKLFYFVITLSNRPSLFFLCDCFSPFI